MGGDGLVTFFIKYVTHDKVKDYEALGWYQKAGGKPCHHCHHAVVMAFDGPPTMLAPPEPEFNSATTCHIDTDAKQPKTES